MTLTNKEVAKVLFKAYRYKKPIDFISENYQLNEEEAYHVQEELIDQLTFKDRSTVTGYKVSMTSKATQAIANTNEPAYGEHSYLTKLLMRVPQSLFQNYFHHY